MKNALHDFYSVVDTSAKSSLVHFRVLQSGRKIIREDFPSL